MRERVIEYETVEQVSERIISDVSGTEIPDGEALSVGPVNNTRDVFIDMSASEYEELAGIEIEEGADLPVHYANLAEPEVNPWIKFDEDFEVKLLFWSGILTLSPSLYALSVLTRLEPTVFTIAVGLASVLAAIYGLVTIFALIAFVLEEM